MKILLTLLLLASPLHAIKYYIDYVGGDDSNDGLSTSNPWKLAPTMFGFSGSYTHAVGDDIIFKGGVTWPNVTLPMVILTGGISTNRDTYGATDPNWYTGGAWSQAIFDAEGLDLVNWQSGGSYSETATAGNVVFFYGSGADYNAISDIRVIDFNWTDPSVGNNSDGWAIAAYAADNISVTNCYSTWNVGVGQDAKCGGFANAYSSSNFDVFDCTIEGPTVYPPEFTSAAPNGWRFTCGTGVYLARKVVNCTIRYTTQGIWGGSTVYGNLVEECCASYRADAHENGAWMFNGTWYNNVFRELGEGVTVYVIPGWNGGTGDSLFYNNILYNLGKSGSINPINITNQSMVLPSENEAWIYNNLLEHNLGFNLGTTKYGEPWKELHLQNNIIISDTSTEYTIVDTLVDDFDVTTLTPNAVFTKAAAAAAGLDESAEYVLSAPVTGITDVGTADVGSKFTLDYDGNLRTGTWDIGPYEWASSPPPVVIEPDLTIATLKIADTTPVAPLIYEDMEGVGLPPGWTQTSGDTGIINWDYTPAAPQGAEWLRINFGSAYVDYDLGQSYDDLWVYAIIYCGTADTSARDVLELRDASTFQSKIAWYNTRVRIYSGVSGSADTDAGLAPALAARHIWLHHTPFQAEVFVSDTNVRPNLPSATSSDNPGPVSHVRLTEEGSQVRVDTLIVSEREIFHDPF